MKIAGTTASGADCQLSTACRESSQSSRSQR